MLKKMILVSAFLLVFCTGCYSAVEVAPESVPLATAVSTEYTHITAPETVRATFPHTEPVTEIIQETEPLTITEQSLYDELYTELSQFHNTIRFNHKIDVEEMSLAVGAIERRHPEIFWINGYSMRYNDISAELTFKVINDYDADTLRRMADELDAAVEAILRNISPDCSDYDKALLIHDYLVEHTVYDEAAVSLDKGLWSTAYGCLINGMAVCQGYSQAFQMLMNRLGIECGICSGDARGEAHAWNYISLNHQYYWIDVTWDDPVPTTDMMDITADWVHHSYFLINDNMLFRSRTIDSDQFQPVCSSLEENYFVRNGNYLTEYDFSEIDRRLSEHLTDGRIEIMFSTAEAYETACKDLFDNETIWTAQVFQKTGGSVNYQPNPDMYILRLIFRVT